MGGVSPNRDPFQPEGHNRRPPHQKAITEGHNRRPLSTRRPPSNRRHQTRRPYQKATPEGHNIRPPQEQTPPEGHNRRPLSTRRLPSTRRPPNQKAIPEGHTRRPYQKATPPSALGVDPPGADTPRSRHPWEQTPTLGADTPQEQTPPAARHAGIPPAMHARIAHPPVNRITDTSKNITLTTTSLRPVIIKGWKYWIIPEHKAFK